MDHFVGESFEMRLEVLSEKVRALPERTPLGIVEHVVEGPVDGRGWEISTVAHDIHAGGGGRRPVQTGDFFLVTATHAAVDVAFGRAG